MATTFQANNYSRMVAPQHQTLNMNSVFQSQMSDGSHSGSPRKTFRMNMSHHKKMSGLQGGQELHHVNEMVSPYSILRSSTDKDVDTTINMITSSCGPRTNRAQLLRQLALKHKFEQNPFLGRTHRFSKAGAMAQGDDPNFNNLNMNYPTLYK